MAQEAIRDVSEGLKAMALIVSVLFGQLSVSVGMPEDRAKSYIEMTFEDAAKSVVVDLWCETAVKAVGPRHVAIGALPEGVLYGSNTLIVLSLAQEMSFLSFVQHMPLTIPS